MGKGYFYYLKSLNSRVRSLISIPESRIAAIVLGSSSRAVSASFERDIAALRIAYKREKKLLRCTIQTSKAISHDRENISMFQKEEKKKTTTKKRRY